ncbi:MAG: 2-succinyl-5-enolpyruvyl-6-hydroxy-3-cyclohexene-1-carboxylic-acid synthase [Thermoleophilaceae bacterium]|nr:2-succinyl-5-enolpyruvyl-6-hydroxy-3-cyclohexene-1-carboxylic-acid synthase [Thermoleophilaceae bacterium]
MIPLNSTFAPLQALVDEWARLGMRNVVTSPGSRNAPLILTLAERIPAVSVLDERSAGFVALGMAKASGLPVAVTCTSGTAAANLLPAVAEASEARVPLIVLSADRPPELRDTGAGQAIDQVKLFGSAAKWFVEVGNHPPSRTTAVYYRSLACRAWATAAAGRPGPVHLNFPLREPLQPTPEEGLEAEDWQGRPDGRPWVEATEAVLEPEQMVVPGRGVIVAGTGADPAAAGAAERLRWPLLAEPTSGLRREHPCVISHYDVLLRTARLDPPDLVVRFGDTPTSKTLREWLAGCDQLVVDPQGAWHEPTRSAARTVSAVTLEGSPAPEQWLRSWREADAIVAPELDRVPEPFEAKAYAALAQEIDVAWVASSMPIREVEAFMPPSPARFLANRGANGIDGTASSALGAAIALDTRVHLLTGELALLHDIGGLLAAKRHGFPLTVVVVNNGGGGIFDFLPLAEHAAPEIFEAHIATPAGVSIERLAALLEVPHTLAANATEVRAAAGGAGIVELRTDRADSVREHRELYDRVVAKLG